MAKLDAAERNKLSASSFGLPGKRAYPVNDKAHARAAKAYASKEEHAGKLSSSEKAQIDRKADRMLGHDRHIGGRSRKSHLKMAMEHMKND